MSLIKKLLGTKRKLSKEEVQQAFKQSCWDLYISNLPDPKIIDVNEKENKKTKEEFIPKGFSIDPKNWTITFNTENIPGQIKEITKQAEYARSIFHHEETHFIKVPGDELTEAILIDSSLKGMKNKNTVKDQELAAAYAYTTLNIFGDLVGDTLLAKEKYGRENFGELTIWRQKETIKAVLEENPAPSLLWQTLVRSYEILWNEDLGTKNNVPIDPQAEKAAENLVKILGKNWKERENWENKVKDFATTLEPIIDKSIEQNPQNGQGKSSAGKGQKQQGQGRGNSNKPDDSGDGQGNSSGQKSDESGKLMPSDVIMQMGDPTKSSLESQNENNGREGRGISEDVLNEIYERNKNSPAKFAGTMSALIKIEANDALRLMYRARAKELLMSIKEKENQRAEKSPSYQTSWNVGDPLIGKGGLELIPSMMNSPKLIPGMTTFKRKLDAAEGHGRLKMIPDLFIEIDSSGSMAWTPLADLPEQRGDFDKAILAAEAAALHAVENGGKVAIINFSGPDNITKQEYTNDLNKIEKAIMVHYNGGTTVPTKETREFIKKTQNPLLTCLISDCHVDNSQQACDDALVYSITEHDNLVVFNINGGSGKDLVNRLQQKGAQIIDVNKIDDLFGVIIGEVKKKYDKGEQNDN
ncbi:hypothetical protein HZA97_09260 [Candidatus Woesearchaeota archaeon]|nr:hypothetical protein [Candidatus Woesearchaeota archaeon]